MNYTGNIYTKFHEVLKKQDSFSVGEKIYSIQRELGGDFMFVTDKDFYEAMDRYLAHPIDSDEKMTDDEFKNWAKNKMSDDEFKEWVKIHAKKEKEDLIDG